MLTEICAELRNYFCQDNNKHFGKYTISGGNIAPLDFLQEGQYFRIVGSSFNDGVHQYPANNLVDEVFDGAVWAMAVPPSFIALAAEIKEYCESDTAKPSPYVSESFGGYSYQRFTNGNGGSGNSWQRVFSDKLRIWRKIQ